jgi:hypothetical protein
MIGIPVTDGTVACPECGLGFANEKRVATHFHRVHSRKIQVPNEGGKRVTASKGKARVGKKWTKAQRAKFKKTMKDKRRNGAEEPAPGAGRHHFSDEQLRLLEGIGFANIMDAMGSKSDRLQDPREFINNCPWCGGKLKAFFLAAGFKHDEPQT